MAFIHYMFNVATMYILRILQYIGSTSVLENNNSDQSTLDEK